MNSKAIASFAFIAFFALMQLEMFQLQTIRAKSTHAAINEAMKAEKLSLIQGLLEQNVDKIIEEKLKLALSLQQSNNEAIKLGINNELMRFFSAVENSYSKETKIYFYFTELNSNNYEKLLEEENAERLSLEKLNELSKVNVLNVAGKAVAAEYHFTGGKEKSMVIFGVIEENNAKKIFVIPRDYKISQSVAS